MSADLGLEVAERVLAELSQLSRKPFQRQLAKLLGCAPTTGAIQEFAEKHPDRWAQAVAIFAPLAGIQRDAPVQVNVFNVSSMSDAELIAQARKLGVALPEDTVDAEIVPSAQASAPGARELVESSAAGDLREVPSNSQTEGDAAESCHEKQHSLVTKRRQADVSVDSLEQGAE